jgi:hypothetical protein
MFTDWPKAAQVTRNMNATGRYRPRESFKLGLLEGFSFGAQSYGGIYSGSIGGLPRKAGIKGLVVSAWFTLLNLRAEALGLATKKSFTTFAIGKERLLKRLARYAELGRRDCQLIPHE